jgi:hypothetical protein
VCVGSGCASVRGGVPERLTPFVCSGSSAWLQASSLAAGLVLVDLMVVSDCAPAARAGAHLEAHHDRGLTGLVAHEKAEETPHRRFHRIGVMVGLNDLSGDSDVSLWSRRRAGRRRGAPLERVGRPLGPDELSLRPGPVVPRQPL